MDFDVPNLLLWKKENKIVKFIFKNNRSKLFFLTVLIIGPLTLLIMFSLMRVQDLEKTKRANSLKIKVYEQSEKLTRQQDEKDRELLEKLNKRVDNIITTGTDQPYDYSVLGFATPSADYSAGQSRNTYYPETTSASVNVSGSLGEHESLGKIET